MAKFVLEKSVGVNSAHCYLFLLYQTFPNNKNPNNSTNILHNKITNPTKLKAIEIQDFKKELSNNLNKINLNNSVGDVKMLQRKLTKRLKAITKKKWVNEEVKKLSTKKAELHFKIKALKQNGHAIPQDLISIYKKTKQKLRPKKLVEKLSTCGGKKRLKRLKKRPNSQQTKPWRLSP